MSTELTSGWLCRDKRSAATQTPLHFLYINMQPEGVWWRGIIRMRHWACDDFTKLYDLVDANGPCALPRPGKCFEVDLEL